MNIETGEKKPYNVYYEMGKEVGRVQVWDAIKFVVSDRDVLDGKPIDEWLERGPDMLIEHIQRYKRDNIKIGDVVRIIDSGKYFVVTVHEPGFDILPGLVNGVNADGHIESEDVAHVERTGFNIRAAVELLDALNDFIRTTTKTVEEETHNA